MTTIYVQNLITSQAQADALPDGTVAVLEGHWPRVLLRDETGQHWADRHNPLPALDMRGWTALIATDVDRAESEPLGTLRHGMELLERTPFAVYIDYHDQQGA